MKIIQFINILNNALLAKKNNIIFYKNKKINEILKIFKNEGYIDYNIKKLNNYQYSLTIQKILFKKLILVSKPSRSYNISYRKLMNIQYDCILHTNIGILSKKNAIKHKVGGFILFKFY